MQSDASSVQLSATITELIERDPWRALATSWPWIPVYVRRLPDVWGQTIWPDSGKPYIELAHDLGPIQQRCTLAHEMHHLEAGRPCRSLCDRDEREVREATARWLLPDLAPVGGTLASAAVPAAAERLNVTTQVLVDRLASLTEVEEAELAAMLPASSGSVAGRARAADGPRRCTAAPACRRPARQASASHVTMA